MEKKLKVRTILEVVGKPKKHVEDTLKEYITKIDQTKQFTIHKKTVKKAKQLEGELFSTFAELEMEFEDLHSVFSFCIDYMPASIEIEDPEQLTFTNASAAAVVNDMIGKMHHVDMVVKTLNQQHKVLSQNIAILVQNSILISIKAGAKKPAQIAKLVGLKEDKMTPFLDKLIKEKKIVKTGETYSLP